MFQIQGIVVQNGLSVGPIRVLRRDNPSGILRLNAVNPIEERFRFDVAKDRAVVELRRLRARVAAHLGDNESIIFLAQSMMLEDETYLKSIYRYIDQCNTAEYAVAEAGRELVALFASLDSSYMQARAADARDLSRRLEGILAEKTDWLHLRQNAAILASEDLTPSDTTLPDAGKLLGLVSHHGSVESHTAILAQAMGAPAMTGICVNPDWDGHIGILDADHATLIIDPDMEALHSIQSRVRLALDSMARRKPKRPCQLHKGKPFHVSAMVSSAWEANDAYEHGASGIGLYRTEFLFTKRNSPPVEEEQHVEYQRTVYAMRGRPVNICLVDFDACRDHLLYRTGPLECAQLWRTQYRAVLRSAAYGPATVSIVLPEAASAQEVYFQRQLLRQCETELKANGTPYKPVRIGVMIRNPRMVMRSDTLAAAADFLLVDGHKLLLESITARHQTADYPTLLWMFRHVMRTGKRHNRRVIVCGDFEQFPVAVQHLLDFGADELCVPPGSLIALRGMIQDMDE